MEKNDYKDFDSKFIAPYRQRICELLTQSKMEQELEKREEKINQEKLELFSRAIGWTITLVGQPHFKPIIEGVDYEIQMVQTDYGDFHVSLCILLYHAEHSEPLFYRKPPWLEALTEENWSSLSIGLQTVLREMQLR